MFLMTGAALNKVEKLSNVVIKWKRALKKHFEFVLLIVQCSLTKNQFFVTDFNIASHLSYLSDPYLPPLINSISFF